MVDYSSEPKPIPPSKEGDFRRNIHVIWSCRRQRFYIIREEVSLKSENLRQTVLESWEVTPDDASIGFSARPIGKIEEWDNGTEVQEQK